MVDSIGERLREARLKKGLKQSDVAGLIACVPSSLTNWESGKVNPSIEVLARLCEVLEVSPLDLLDEQYTYAEIVEIVNKPAYERTYPENIALNFSGSILERLMPSAMQHAVKAHNEDAARFIRDNRLIDRFSGLLTNEEIETLQRAYRGTDKDSDINADLLFAFHALKNQKQWVLIEVLQGLMLQEKNILPLVGNMDKALKYTMHRLANYPGGADYVLDESIK